MFVNFSEIEGTPLNFNLHNRCTGLEQFSDSAGIELGSKNIQCLLLRIDASAKLSAHS
jgi:hypothetical protein